MKVIKLESTFNTRDLSSFKTTDGKSIKENRLIRSGHLHTINENDIKTLKKHNVKIIVDFRSEHEFVNKADKRIEGVTYLNFPALPKKELASTGKSSDSNLLDLVSEDKGGKKMLLETYKNLFLTKEGIEAYKNFFKVVTENKDGAILWHCSQGKDRAGMAAFLLEYALGLSMNDMIEDYLYTNIAMEKVITRLTPVVLKESNNNHSLLPHLRDVFTAQMDYLNASIQTINETYGSIENYLINTLEVDIEKLKENYLI